jgi:hypothetical protein
MEFQTAQRQNSQTRLGDRFGYLEAPDLLKSSRFSDDLVILRFRESSPQDARQGHTPQQSVSSADSLHVLFSLKFLAAISPAG